MPEIDAAAAKALTEASIFPVAEIEADDAGGLAKHMSVARAAGYRGVLFSALETESETAQAVHACGGLGCMVSMSPEQIGWDVRPALAVLRYGQWPGVHSGDAGSAGATESPWIDANSYLVSYLRATHPERPAWLGYRADQAAGVPADRMLSHESVELALVEASAAGGNVILDIPERYRRGLADGDRKAVEAWRALVETATFLRKHREELHRPQTSLVAAAAEDIEEQGEILNLLFRSNVAPVALGTESNGVPAGVKVLVAAGAPWAAGMASQFARSGGTVMAAPGLKNTAEWWTLDGSERISGTKDVVRYRAGRGEIIAYADPIYDPAEFAFDVMEVTDRRRAVRLWGPAAMLCILHRQPRGVSVELINYGSTAHHFLIRVEGEYRQATLLRPEAKALKLESRSRDGGSEIEIPVVRRFARLILE
jgi:hypothetical protein